MKIINIEIPFKTPSINLMYVTWSPRGSPRTMRIKSKEAKAAAKEVEKIVKESSIEQIDGELEVSITIYSNWYNKDGTIKKKDVANLEKFITDSIFASIEGMDDKQIFKITMNKIQSEIEKSIIKITEYNGKKEKQESK